MTREDRRFGRDDTVQSLQASKHQPHAVGSPYLPKFTFEERIPCKESTCLPKVVAEGSHGVTGGMEDFDRSVSELQRLAVVKQQICFQAAFLLSKQIPVGGVQTDRTAYVLFHP